MLLSCSTMFAVTPRAKKMKAFRSERELQNYFRKIAERQKRSRAAKMTINGSVTETVTVTSDRSYDESITNTQHEGVDEGDIVKLHGNHLVVLRRGRLFTVELGDSGDVELKPVSIIDAFGPDLDPKESWYDEMLISGDTIVVIGYSYQREGTEVGLFHINAQGQLTYRSTFHLRSNDYYSSRNYASRLIGSKLIFYSPLYFYAGDKDPSQSFPAVRKWHKGANANEFRRIIPATHFYLPQTEFDVEDGVTLHTVTICDLANGGFDCNATSVIGPPGDVFYVSPDSVYVWASSWSDGVDRPGSLLFRMPLDGSGPGALQVSGGPVDQFSFLESEDNYLNVLVRSESKGDGMWAAEVAEGDVALMRIPLTSFSDGSQMVPRENYRTLPKPEGRYYFQNRFVGRYLIYGTGSGWGYPDGPEKHNEVFMVSWMSGDMHRLDLPHGVDRIEQMGSGAVIIGADPKDLHFTSIRLNASPGIVSRYTYEGASQGELRSHGFFYKAETPDSGTLGLPISVPGRPGHSHLFESSAAIVFLRNEGLRLRRLGDLTAQPDKASDDDCRASCVDWYGNARPLFIRGRVFALLGYELVEGKFAIDQMTELRRTLFAPQVTQP
jgi:hypothetical protein